MGILISSKSTANRHGAFAIEVQPPLAVRATGTGVVAHVAQFPWGPVGSVYTPTSYKNALDTFAPAGMSRTGSGYLGLAQKGWPSLRIVRVLGPTAVKAFVMLTSAAPANIIRLELKYHGTAGNSVVATVSAASDGDALHFNLKVEITGATGVTTDFFQSLNYSGTGADSVPDLTNCYLVGALAKQTSGRPVNGTYVLASGTDGTVTSAEYVGTAGAPDKGISLLETDKSIRHVVADDCGNSLRAAVNAGLKAHAELMGDRFAYLSGNSGQTLSAVKADVASYRSTHVRYADPWHRMFDDTTGAKQLVPTAALLASVKAQLSPSTSDAWKNAEVMAMTRCVVELETDRGDAAGQLTEQGITTLTKEEDGGFTFEAGVVTIAPSEPAKRNATRTAMLIYIATALTKACRSIIDAPNVEANQLDIIRACDTFLAGLKAAQTTDPNHTPHIRDYSIKPLNSTNAQASIDAGDLEVFIEAKTSSAIERLFFSLKVGETVTITAS